jgi:23S rRNA G2445 N2-methylase RlmL
MTDFFAPCPRGLESVLHSDLDAMGAQKVRTTEGGVHFSGDWQLCYRVNLESRVASRVLWRVKETWYRTEQDIYKAVFDLQWQHWFNVSHTIRVNTTAIRCALKSLEFITLLVKDAVCDRFREHCDERPSVDTLDPDVRIHVFIEDEKLMLYLRRCAVQAWDSPAYQYRADKGESGGRHFAPVRMETRHAIARPDVRQRYVSDRGGADGAEHSARYCAQLCFRETAQL